MHWDNKHFLKLQHIPGSLEGHVKSQSRENAQEKNKNGPKLSPLTALQVLHREEAKAKAEL